MTDERIARFEKRQEELKKMSDEQLKERFWTLCEQVVAPIVELAKTHTSPSIERAVLLRMGIDSLSSHGVVDRIQEAGLLGKGAARLSSRGRCPARCGRHPAATSILVAPLQWIDVPMKLRP